MSDIPQQKDILKRSLYASARDALSCFLIDTVVDDLHDSVWESTRASLRRSLYGSLRRSLYK